MPAASSGAALLVNEILEKWAPTAAEEKARRRERCGRPAIHPDPSTSPRPSCPSAREEPRRKDGQPDARERHSWWPARRSPAAPPLRPRRYSLKRPAGSSRRAEFLRTKM